MNIFSGNGLWQLVIQADTISKLVLLLLFCMSVISWTIFIGKLALLQVKERQFKEINKKVQKAKTISDLVEISALASKTAPGYFMGKNLAFLKELLSTALDSSSSFNGRQTQENRKLGVFEWEMFERHMDNNIDAFLMHNEEYISFLSSCAAVGPLLGLFGTIWGLIHSFMRISETQIADIATIAPGIAEALITTIAGLIVAIPALVMFNYLQTKTRKLEHLLIALADRITLVLQQVRER